MKASTEAVPPMERSKALKPWLRRMVEIVLLLRCIILSSSASRMFWLVMALKWKVDYGLWERWREVEGNLEVM